MLKTLNNTLKKLVYSKYTDWDNKWVHYTKEPYVKVNPKSMYRDPAGIYLFPAAFEPVRMWLSLPYKFIIDVPKDLVVLDLSLLTREGMFDLATKILGKEPLNEYKEYILKGPRYLDNGWEAMYMPFIGKAGEFNKRFRQLGYDAIFDDTKTIHSQEVQLLILDPKKIKVVEMQRQVDSGYDDTLLIMDYVKELCEDWGLVKVEKPKKKRKYGEENIEGYLTVEAGDRYLSLTISPGYYPGFKKEESKPPIILVSKTYSNPDIGMGAGATFDRNKRSFSEVEKEITKLLSKIF
jgi:hypothetical protein